jgi:hypothetical protein
MDTLFPLLSTPAPCAQEGEYAMKRRKTNYDSTVKIPQAEFSEQSSIVLAKISLDLVSINAVLKVCS